MHDKRLKNSLNKEENQVTNNLDSVTINEDFILEFARGEDLAYNERFAIYSNKIYEKSIEYLVCNFGEDFLNDIIIVYLTASFELRKKRNKYRSMKGGYSVAKDVMESVYKKDNFEFIHLSCNYGYTRIMGKTIPVFNLINEKEIFNNIELEDFFCYNIEKIFEYYNTFKNFKI